jgi:23S rRNA pseudouridine1911/1915/1917 synthase
MPPPSRDAAAVFHVSPEVAGRTVSAAMRAWLPERSWSQVRQLVRSRRVTVNGNVCVDESRRLAETDVVKLLSQSAKKPPDEQDVRLQYLDQHVVVVEKPAGVTSNRHAEEKGWPSRRRQLQPTLDELLPEVIARAEGRGRKRRGAARPVRAVHRLDRETSGLMVFARTVLGERGLVEQFRRHTTHRRYLAVAQGRVAAATLKSRLVRDRGDGRRGSTKLANVGKDAVTHVRPVEYFNASGEQYTLVECKLETGRTHQIRIHLAEAGHPLCGEAVYHRPLFGTPIEDRSQAPRIALHAAELGFMHPVSGEQMQFTMPLPNDLSEFIHRLRSSDA